MAGTGKSISFIYEQRRIKALRDVAHRRDTTYERIPALSDLDAEIGKLGVHHARSILRDEPESTVALSAQMAQLRQRRILLLEEAGLPGNWLEPWWICDHCKDTGYLQAEDGNPKGPCSCSRQLMLEHLYQSSNLSQDPEIGFDRYRDQFYSREASREKHGISLPVREHMNNVRDRMRLFTEQFDNPDTRSLYLYGPTGTGKTFLAKCAGKALLENGRVVLYLSAPDFFEAARTAKFGDNDRQEAANAYRRILDADLLILDDLGTEPSSDSRSADLLHLLEERSRPGIHTRHTIIASNMDMKRIYAVYFERIGSRIAGEFDVLPFAGEDIRIKKRFG